MSKNNRGSYHCPNSECKNHKNPETGFFIKKGYYFTKHNSKKVPRYQCKCCGTKFSSNTFKDIKGQHKPELNDNIFTRYASNESQNRIAKNLRINVKTVVRKIKYLAYKSRQIHEEQLKNKKFQVYQIQFDEMETFEHTRMKPVTIAIAVESYWDDVKRKYRTGRIIDAIAAPMYYKSRNARKAQETYGDREDQSLGARIDVVESMKKAAAKPDIRVLTDGKRSYGTLFTDIMPQSRHQVISRKMNTGLDKLFSLNHTCARLRHDMSRMARQSWVTTKTVEGLQDHLDLFIAYYNEYFT
jgi:transposase-like protein